MDHQKPLANWELTNVRMIQMRVLLNTQIYTLSAFCKSKVFSFFPPIFSWKLSICQSPANVYTKFPDIDEVFCHLDCTCKRVKDDSSIDLKNSLCGQKWPQTCAARNYNLSSILNALLYRLYTLILKV